METVSTCESSTNLYDSTRRNNPEHSHLPSCCSFFHRHLQIKYREIIFKYIEVNKWRLQLWTGRTLLSVWSASSVTMKTMNYGEPVDAVSVAFHLPRS
jgi:hypothetical protein